MLFHQSQTHEWSTGPQAYDKRRQEREGRQEREEKQEKDVKPRPKFPPVIKPKTVGIVPPLVSSLHSTPTSSKRNLTSRLEMAESVAKRRRVSLPEKKRRGATRRKGRGPRQSQAKGGSSSPIKIVQLQTTDRDALRSRTSSPRKSVNPKADMESLFLAAGLEVHVAHWQLKATLFQVNTHFV